MHANFLVNIITESKLIGTLNLKQFKAQQELRNLTSHSKQKLIVNTLFSTRFSKLLGANCGSKRSTLISHIGAFIFRLSNKKALCCVLKNEGNGWRKLLIL